MMVFSLRDFDEKPFFEKYAGEYGLELVSTPEPPTAENAYLAEGCRYINIITTPLNRQLLEKFHSLGAEYVVTRTIGYDHIDMTAAKELGSRGITVNAVAPGFIHTPMTDKLTEEQKAAMLGQIAMKRYGEVSEISGVVSFLLSDDASYVTGQTIEISGGIMM